MTSYDLVLRGGHVVTTARRRTLRADVGIVGDRIVRVGRIPGDAVAREELDVEGHYLFPGFIDTHVHADAALFDPQVQLACLRQGITTLVLGQDGLSFAPSGATTLAYVEDYFGAVNGRHPAFRRTPCSVSDLLTTYHLTTPLNVGYLAPHGTIRHVVMGVQERPPTPDELDVMCGLLNEALDQGALGISTGLTYLPGAFADTAELRALCRVVAGSGGVHVTHMRGYDEQVEMGMKETVDIGSSTGCGTHVSHYHGPGGLLVDLADQAASEGADLTFDSYPYLRGSSILAVAALPTWIQRDGPQVMVERLADPDVVRRLHAEWFPTIRASVLHQARLSHVGSADLRWAEGLSLEDAAARAGFDVPDFVCELFRRAGSDVGCVFGQTENSDDGVRQVMRHRLHMAGSDGIYIGSHPHPRGWGAFARFLGRHTRELRDFDWPEAARHLSTSAVRRFGFGDRGDVRAGFVADIAVVDPATVRDTATYDNPRSLAEGVPHVVVAGRVVLRDGRLTGALAGRPLRRTR